jgi:hypothetical protein
MEIIKYNELNTRKKYLISFSIYKMLDTYRPFDIYFNNFKLLLPFLTNNQELFDVRVYFDNSCHKDIEPYIKEYPNIEFYKCNYYKLRINEYHHGVFGKLLGYLSLFEKSNYEYINITDVLHRPEWIDFKAINYMIENKIDTYFYLLPKGEEKNKISLPLLTRIKLDKDIIDNFLNDITTGKYNDVIHKKLIDPNFLVSYNYDVKFPYGMDSYFINDVVYDKLCSGSVYVKISYDLLRLINNMYKLNYDKIYKMDQRSKELLEELKKLSEIKFNADDQVIRGTIISLIIKFIDKFGRHEFVKLFGEKEQTVIRLFYKFIDNNKDKINSNTLTELSEIIKLK